MNWEALAAIGSILSAVVIAVTVIFTARQVRVTIDQLEQLRRSTQFDAARTVLLEMVDPVFVEGYRFVYLDLQRAMTDESFRKELALIGTADEHVHKELTVLRALDRIGTYVRFGLVDGDIVYSAYGHRITLCHDLLREVIAVHSRIAGSQMYPNFEFLDSDCRRWFDAHGIVVDMTAIRRRIAEHETSSAEAAAASAAD